MPRGKNRNGNKGKQARRANLMREDPHCWYCGCEVFPGSGHEGAVRPDLATVEHLFSRHYGSRPQTGSRVLACRECNTSVGHYADLLLNEGIISR